MGTSTCIIFQGSRACTYSSAVDTNLHATTGCETIRAGCSDAKRKKKRKKEREIHVQSNGNLGDRGKLPKWGGWGVIRQVFLRE